MPSTDFMRLDPQRGGALDAAKFGEEPQESGSDVAQTQSAWETGSLNLSVNRLLSQEVVADWMSSGQQQIRFVAMQKQMRGAHSFRLVAVTPVDAPTADAAGACSPIRHVRHHRSCGAE
jgi:hypothetical protein